MPSSVAVGLFYDAEALAATDGVFDFHADLAEAFVLFLLLFGQFPALGLFVRYLGVGVVFFDALVAKVPLDLDLFVDLDGGLPEHLDVRLAPLGLDAAVDDRVIFLIYNELRLDNMFFL